LAGSVRLIGGATSFKAELDWWFDGDAGHQQADGAAGGDQDLRRRAP
jgi:hypothetical protein